VVTSSGPLIGHLSTSSGGAWKMATSAHFRVVVVHRSPLDDRFFAVVVMVVVDFIILLRTHTFASNVELIVPSNGLHAVVVVVPLELILYLLGLEHGRLRHSSGLVSL
jgi:hypothetical protein